MTHLWWCRKEQGGCAHVWETTDFPVTRWDDGQPFLLCPQCHQAAPVRHAGTNYLGHYAVAPPNRLSAAEAALLRTQTLTLRGLL